MDGNSKQEIVFDYPQNLGEKIVSGKINLSQIGHLFLPRQPMFENAQPLNFSAIYYDFRTSSKQTKSSEDFGKYHLFSANSMTKIVVATTILRMMEEDIYKDFLSRGLDTRLSYLLPLLKKYYPDSQYIQTQLEQEPNFQEINLRNLFQHSSGIKDFDYSKLTDILSKRSTKLTETEIIDLPREENSEFGVHRYGDVNYQLLGMLISSIFKERDLSTEKGFGNIVNELVIDRIRKKNPALSLNFITSDKIQEIAGNVEISDAKEMKIEGGKFYSGNNLHDFASWRFARSFAGAYADCESMAIIARHILHQNPEVSIYKNPEFIKSIFDQSQFLEITGDGMDGNKYGFGFRHQENLYHHRGLGFDSAGVACFDSKNDRMVIIFASFENLTLPLSYALLYSKKSDNSIELSEDLYKKSQELRKDFSAEELLKMRNCLEKSYEEFITEFNSICDTKGKKPANAVTKAAIDLTNKENSATL